jgi:hypothetical protein
MNEGFKRFLGKAQVERGHNLLASNMKLNWRQKIAATTFEKKNLQIVIL